MKRVAIEDLASSVSDLVSAMETETVVLTRSGKPFAFVSDASQYDWEDIRYMTDAKFWKTIEERRAEPATVTLEEVEARVAQREAAESKKDPSRHKGTNKKAS